MLFFNKFAGLRRNFCESFNLRIAFFVEHLRWLFLQGHQQKLYTMHGLQKVRMK